MKKMLAALLLAFAPALLAQERRPGQPSGAPAPGSKETEAPEKTERAAAKETPRDQISTTQHSVTVDGQTINYTARAGTIVMKDEEGTPKASFFFVSYTRDGADRRPCGCIWERLVRSGSRTATTRAMRRYLRIGLWRMSTRCSM